MENKENNQETNQENNVIDFKTSDRFKQLETLLTCKQCKQILCDPITLLCQHTFCQSCIITNSDDKCFICKLEMMMPINSNFQLKSIIEKMYDADFFKERRERFKEEMNKDLKMKKKYEIYKNYFNTLINKVNDKNGKFSMTNSLIYFG